MGRHICATVFSALRVLVVSFMKLPAWKATEIQARKGAQTQTFGPDIFRWGRALLREGVGGGAKKLGMSLEIQGKV